MQLDFLAGGKLPRQDGLHGLGRAATPRQKVAEDLIKLFRVGLIDFIVQGHSKNQPGEMWRRWDSVDKFLRATTRPEPKGQ
jgi:hypothetical protein